MPRQRTSEDELLRVALRVFAEKGYHGTHITDIHRQAGVGRGTFYLYFGSKEEVFARVVERALAPLRQVLTTPPEVLARFVPSNLRRRSFDVLVDATTSLLDSRDATRVCLREAYLAGPHFSELLDTFFEELKDYFARTAAVLQGAGWLDARVSAAATATLLLGAFREAIMAEIVRPSGRSARELVAELMGVLLQGAAGPRLRDAWAEGEPRGEGG